MARFAGRALGVFFVASLFAGVLGACTDEPALGAFAEACNINEQCRGDMICDSNILDGQCTSSCTSDEQCTAEFPNSRCYTGQVRLEGGVVSVSRCVLLCEAKEDCPGSALECNNLGWCGRSAIVSDGTGTGGMGPVGTGGTGGAGATGGGDAAAGVGGATGGTDAGP